MKVKYFHDTATVLIEFSTDPIAETKEINENVYIDFDATGNLVAITVEHIGDRKRKGTLNTHDQ